MKITIRGVLLNVEVEKEEIVDNIMLVFCTAIRYSFKRLLEGIKVGDLEKDVAKKYNLNIRQSKDAVENARQTILSQRELVKTCYENYLNKVNKVQEELNRPKLSDKKRKALLKKLDKRQRKLNYYKKFIDTNTIPSVVFGAKEMFLKRCKGLISKEEWQSCRNNRVYSRGDKTKKGNPNLRVVIINNMSYLEISTLEKDKNNHAVKIRIPLYLPQKLSKKTGKINGRNYRQMFLDFLQTGEAYQVEVIKRKGKYHVYITFDIEPSKVIYTGHNGMLGIDTNPDGFALTYIDRNGNYKWCKYLKQHELVYARSDRRTNLCGELAKQVVDIAKEHNCGIAFENLYFKDDKDLKDKLSRIRHQFVYSKLLIMLEDACLKDGVEYNKVHPAYTSKIGLYKYCHQYGLDVHNGAAMVIARRSYGYDEKVPKLLVDKLVDDKEKFNIYNEWKQWTIISNLIKEKGGEKPALWLKHRKLFLGVA